MHTHKLMHTHTHIHKKERDWGERGVLTSFALIRRKGTGGKGEC